MDVVQDRARENTVSPPSRDLAQQWAKTAIAFIFSALLTAIFVGAAYILWPMNRVPAIPCIALAVFFALIFAYNSFFIVRWWIVLAKKSEANKRN